MAWKAAASSPTSFPAPGVLLHQILRVLRHPADPGAQPAQFRDGAGDVIGDEHAELHDDQQHGQRPQNDVMLLVNEGVVQGLPVHGADDPPAQAIIAAVLEDQFVPRDLTAAEQQRPVPVIDEQILSPVGLLVFFHQGRRVLPVAAGVDVGVDIGHQRLGVDPLALQLDLVLHLIENREQSGDGHQRDADEGDQDLVLNAEQIALLHGVGPPRRRSTAETRNMAAVDSTTPNMAGWADIPPR